MKATKKDVGGFREEQNPHSGMGRVAVVEDGESPEAVVTRHGTGLGGLFFGWLAWERRGRTNRILFGITTGIAAFVTLAFAWATVNPSPGDFTRYLVFYWIWGLCALDILFGMAEYKTSPLRKRRERGHLFILLYIGALLIVTRALNMILYGGY